MAYQTRSRAESTVLRNPGPYLARVVNHLDTTYMGGLLVSIIKNVAGVPDTETSNVPVRYCSPFSGSTSQKFEGNNSSDFNDVQKSYGMWMVPPDIGSTVMVMFIDGDLNQGYWFGCISDIYQNHMIPGIAASRYSAMTPEQRKMYGTDYVPVAEYHKKSRDLSIPNVDSLTKPVHPFADRLMQQGLLLDTIRGVTSSGARREIPSQVFGISTPGPIDQSLSAKRQNITGLDGSQVNLPVSRLGGTTFVMDDGDQEGQNELVRIRTRTGHQILMHNTSDLVYIANSKGTAWIELTSNGKIDVYAEDSVSIHTAQDFNFRADRDINLEAGRSINIRALKNMETNVAGYYYLTVDDYARIAIRNDKDETIGQTSRISVGQDLNQSITKNVFVTTGGELNLGASGDIRIGTGGNYNVGAAGNYLESATRIDMNGPAAESPKSATPAEMPALLPTYSLPNRNGGTGWADGRFYKDTPIQSILQRAPTHEPWDQHENINPTQFRPAATDVTVQSRAAQGVPDTANTGAADPANTPEVVPGTCDATFAKAIGAPAAQPGIQAIKAACTKANITNAYIVATMLGVAGGESLWQLVTENFNYKSDRLLQVFPSVFKGNRALADQYAGNPNNSLPEFLYGAQSAKGQGLGNTLPGDGAKFIGRGYIGLTGRANYTKFSKLLHDGGFTSSPTSLIDNPEMVNDPSIAGAIVVLYFQSHPLLKTANKNPGPDYFEIGYKAVGFCTPDIHARKLGYYQCFLGQLAPQK